jgi:hypothetical protein
MIQEKKITGQGQDVKALPIKTKKYKHLLRLGLLASLFIFFGLVMFDTKIFLMGDDADYILDAYRFIHNGIYPVGRSSLYTMVLGIPVALFGTNVVLLKWVSFAFALTGFCLLYQAFHKRLSGWILYPVMIFSAISGTMQYYSSSNLSEAFFMMIQYGYIGTVFLLIDKLELKNEKQRKYWLLTGFMSLCISLSKNIAVVAPMGLIVYFLVYKQWRNALLALGSFLLFKLPYELMLRLVIKQNTLVDQWGQVLAKDIYHPENGKESVTGYINRFLTNIQIYFSSVTLGEFGITIKKKDMLVLAAFLFIGILLFALLHSRKRNKYVFFTAIYTAVMCSGIFVALQPKIYQGRIIIILVPLLLLLTLYTIYVLLKYFNKRLPSISPVGMSALLFFMLVMNLKSTSGKIKETLPTLLENIGSDPLSGYTPDWINYLKMGAWVKKNIPDGPVIAARKANSLSIYSNGRPYFGISSCPSDLDATQLLEKLKKDKIEYMVVANLRANSEVYIPNNIITTMHRYIITIERKYPHTFKIVHRIGTQEPCLLVQIRYPKNIVGR